IIEDQGMNRKNLLPACRRTGNNREIESRITKKFVPVLGFFQAHLPEDKRQTRRVRMVFPAPVSLQHPKKPVHALKNKNSTARFSLRSLPGMYEPMGIKSNVLKKIQEAL